MTIAVAYSGAGGGSSGATPAGDDTELQQKSGSDLAGAKLYRSAGTLVQRNGATPQAYRITDSYTDDSNFAGGGMRFNSSVFEVGPEAAGSGTLPQMRIPLGTVTTSKPLDLRQTWNGVGVTFTGLKIDITDTASSDSSRLLDLQVGGNSKFYVTKLGGASFADTVIGTSGTFQGVVGAGFFIAASGGNESARMGYNQLNLNSDSGVGWTNSSTSADAAAVDTAIRRDSAGVIGVDSGAAGIWRDLKLRNMIATGNLATGAVAKTASYTATANDGTIECDATIGAITITLPAVSACAGRIYVIKKTDASGNAVTVDPNASETIDGAATVSLASQYSTLIVQGNAAGTAWHKIAAV